MSWGRVLKFPTNKNINDGTHSQFSGTHKDHGLWVLLLGTHQEVNNFESLLLEPILTQFNVAIWWIRYDLCITKPCGKHTHLHADPLHIGVNSPSLSGSEFNILKSIYSSRRHCFKLHLPYTVHETTGRPLAQFDLILNWTTWELLWAT